MSDFDAALSLFNQGSSKSVPFVPGKSYGTPPAILNNLIRTESSGNPYAINKTTKAIGPAQFTPETLAYLHQRGVVFDPFDPQQARSAADWYLQDLKNRNGGDLNKAVAAYGGFVNKDPSGYQAKVLGTPQQSQNTQEPDDFDGALGLFKNPQYVKQNWTQPNQSNPAQQVKENVVTSSPMLSIGLNQLTGLGAQIIGGWRGLATLATGGSMDDAANAVREEQQNRTYQPEQGTTGARAVQAFGSDYNPLTWIPKLGNAAGEKTADITGSPALGAAVNTGINAVPLIMGAKAAFDRPISGLVKVAPATDADMSFASARSGMPAVTNEPSPTVETPQNVPTGSAQQAVSAQPIQQQASPSVQEYKQPSIEEASPELQQAYQQAKAQGLPINQDALRRHLEANTLPVRVDLTEGQATQDPSTISNEMNSRGSRGALVSPDFYNQQGKALGQNLDVIRQNVAPNVVALNPTDHGQVLIDAYKNFDAGLKSDIDAKYQALRDANGGEFPVDARTLYQSISDAFKKQLNSAKLTDGPVGSQMKELSNLAEDGQMTMEQYLALRRNLGDISRTASDGTDRAMASLAIQKMEELPLQDGAADLKPLADSARQAARNRFQLMESDPAYKAAANDSVEPGQASPLADDFVRKYIINGRRADIANMRNNLSGDPLAQQTIPAATVDYLKNQAKADVETGKFNAATYNSTLSKIQPKFDVLTDPQTAGQLTQLGNVAKYTTAQPKGSFVNNSNTMVGAASDIGKQLFKGWLNVKTMGASGVAGKVMDAVKTGKASKAATAPGAGVTKLSDFIPPGQ